jgi:hypothetical protein
MPNVNGKLTPKQRLFVDYYLVTWNATEAARQAGYKGNDVTLGSIGYENLRKSYIQEEIQKRTQELSEDNREILVNALNRIRENGNHISTGKQSSSGIVYLIGEEHGAVKIGKTISIIRRFRSFDTLIPYRLNLILSIEVDDMHSLELELHQKFAAKRIKGEWFNLSLADIEWVKNKYGR